MHYLVYYGIICVLFLAAPIQAQQRESAAQQESPKAKASVSPPALSTGANENPNVQQPESRVEQTKTAKNEADRSWQSVTRAEWMQLGINALLFVIVLWQTLIYIQQRNIMRQQVALAKITERAYIGIANIETEDIDKIGSYPNVRITIINGGRTPAYKLKAPGHMTFTKAGQPFPHERPESSDEASERFLPAGSPVNFNYSFVIPWTVELADAVGRERYFIYLHVEVQFDDVWGDTHIQPFKLSFHSGTGRWGSYSGQPKNAKPQVTIT